MPRSKREPRTALTFGEMEAVMKQAVEEKDWKMHCAFLFAYHHGLRSKELAKMTIDDLKADDLLFVDRCKHSKTTLQALVKTKGSPHLDEVKARDKWLTERAKSKTTSKALFISQKTDGHLRREQFSRAFRGIAQRAGLPAHKQFIHSLKHSLCTHMAEVGKSLPEIASVAGHKAISSTAAYVHISDAQGMRAQQSMIDQLRQKDGNSW